MRKVTLCVGTSVVPLTGFKEGRVEVIKFRKRTRAPEKLTKTTVERFNYDSSDSGYSALRDTEIPGFEVRAYPNEKTWSFRYRSPKSGKQRVMKIGPCREITAHQARQIATKARGLVLAGEDPQDTRDEVRAARKAARFGDVAQRWVDEYAKVKRKTWETDVMRLFPQDKGAAVYKLHLTAVTDRDALVDALRELHRALADTPVAANRLIATINAIANHATKERWVSGLRNLAEDVDRYPENHREDFLRPGEFGKFLGALDSISRNQEHWRTLIMFLMYTGARYSEGVGLRKDDVFHDAGVFVFRATKNGTDHELPLTPTLSALIDAAPPWDGETVWKPMESRKAFAQIRKSHAFVSFISPHALRHTLRTTMLVELHIGLDIVDAVTNHKSDYGAGSRYVHVSKAAVSDAIERYVAWIAAR